MEILIPTITAVVLLGVLIILSVKWKVAAQAEFIRNYTLPAGLYEKLRKKRPALALKDCQLVGQALRQFFLAYLKSGCKFVSMPSQVVDDLWHEFILYTRDYDHFCKKAFGRFLHHTPAVVLSLNKQTNIGLRRTWWFACRGENINPRHPTRLPLLFAIDAKLNIEDGFRYSADCRGLRKDSLASPDGGAIYCGSDFSSASYDGTNDGLGDSSFGNGDHGDGGSADGGDGGGCGGGGCGGGD